MVGLIAETGWKCLISIGLTAVAIWLFPALLSLGTDNFQTAVVLASYIYCVVVLFSYSENKLFHVLSIPVLTQFLHLFQRYTFAAGANSIWRLLPFLILDCYFLNFFIRSKPSLELREHLFLTFWICLSILFLCISPNLPNIFFGAIVLTCVTLPGYFIYLRISSQSADFRGQLEMYLSLLYILLGIGTFGLVLAGASYKGSENLLATRNITDTNITMAYFVLLWPFALLFAKRQHYFQGAILAVFASIFLGVVLFSFSRGAVLLILPYMFVTVGLSFGRWLFWLTIIALAMIVSIGFGNVASINNADLAYFWQLRFADFSIYSAFEKLMETSGRVEIHAVAYKLFLQSPVVGHGTGSFEVLGPGYREAHSLWYTLLAENGLAGAILMYSVFFKCGLQLFEATYKSRIYHVLPLSLLTYLIFNHTVGSVFVIIPAKSVTITCIAPVLLLCLYYYSKSLEMLDLPNA